MRVKKRLILILLLMTSVAQAGAQNVDFLIVEKGLVSAKQFSTFTFEGFREKNTFLQTYQKIHSNRIPAPQPPKIDFDSSFVLILYFGEKKSTGHRVEIEAIKKAGNILKINARLTSPQIGSLHAPMMSYPFAILMIQKSHDSIDRIELFDQKNRLLDGQVIRWR